MSAWIVLRRPAVFINPGAELTITKFRSAHNGYELWVTEVKLKDESERVFYKDLDPWKLPCTHWMGFLAGEQLELIRFRDHAKSVAPLGDMLMMSLANYNSEPPRREDG